jgi:hypothetical protein
VAGYGSICPTCGRPIGYPNVEEADQPDERAALDARYQAAMANAITRGTDSAVANFERALTASRAVINVSLDSLFLFMTTDQPYLSYRQLVREGFRARAAGRRDAHRAGVDGTLFGTHDEEIRMAALSLDGRGLQSYGPYTVSLDEVAIGHRASLLEENSFDFVQRHNLDPGDAIPPGYRATWSSRGKLAVAKLAATITAATVPAQFPAILLSAGSRATDQFIEVHIYGPFDRYAVNCVCGPRPGASNKERAMLAAIQDVLDSRGGTWI